MSQQGLLTVHGSAPVYTPAYAELHVLSSFSFQRGASQPEELVARAHRLGYRALAVTDECSVAGVVRAHGEAKLLGVKLIPGAEFAVSLAGRAGISADAAELALRIVVLPHNLTGWGNLCEFITRARRAAPKGHYRLVWHDAPWELLAHCEVLLAWQPLPPSAITLEAACTVSMWAAGFFGREPCSVSTSGKSLCGHAVCVGKGGARVAGGGHEAERMATQTPEGKACAGARSLLGSAFCSVSPGLRPPPFTSTKRTAEQVSGGGLGSNVWLASTRTLEVDDALHQHRLEQISALTGIPLVAVGNVHMHARSRKPLHDVLTAIRLGRPVAQCGFELQVNAELHLRTRERIAALYPPEQLANTLVIADKCSFSLDELRYHYPMEAVLPGHTPAQTLRQYTEEGVLLRYPPSSHPLGLPPQVRVQLEHELALISELKYEMYFLTVHDIVRFARERGILCQGRGSAANSAVCYCLGITEVDPSITNVLFERFISKERGEPPDIDVDFEHQRREEVIQYIYAKYGRDRAAIAATVISYRPRSALRDVGRALDIPEGLITAMAKEHPGMYSREVLVERLQSAIERVVNSADLARATGDFGATGSRSLGGNGLSAGKGGARKAGGGHGAEPSATQTSSGISDFTVPSQRRLQLWLDLATQLQRFPRHLSQHVGGFVLTQGPLTRLVPVENASMKERSIIQWDKDDLDAVGLMKVDVLALGMLSAIRRCLALVGQWSGRPWAMQDIPREDPATYEMICQADTVGVFQIESRAQMSMLPRLKPRCFYDLVVEVAIVRPGPIQGGMVHPYLQARAKGKPEYSPYPALEKALQRTHGVPIFQEQVMQIAVLAADFSPGEADALRRSMAAWKRSGGVHAFRERFIAGMLKNQYPLEFAEAIFRQMEGFGEYGFPESHAASFAILVYLSCWLKRHEPACFLAAMLNSQPLGFYGPAQLVQDAQRHSVTVLPADVSHSDWDCTLDSLATTSLGEAALGGDQPCIRLGLRMVSGLLAVVAERIVLERQQKPFGSTQDLALRCQLDGADLKALASSDALLSLSGHRRQQVWDASALQPAPALLRGVPIEEDELQLVAASEGEEVTFDYASIGLTLRSHPLQILRGVLSKMKLLTAAQMAHYPSGRLVRACGIVTMRQQPGTAKGVVFVTLEDETGSVNVIVWKAVKERFRQELYRARLMAVYGVWQRDEATGGRVRHVIAKRLVDMTHLLGELATTSRDFH